MTAPVIKGTDGMTLVARPKSYSKSSGETQSEEWRGPLAKAVLFYGESIVDPDIDSVDIRPDVGKAVATVTLTRVDPDGITNEDDNALWEVDSNEVFRDLRTHPYFTKNGTIVQDLDLVDEKLKRGDPYVVGDYTTPNIAKRYFGLRSFGVEGYYVAVLVLRKTITVSARSDIEAAYTGVNAIQALTVIDPPSKLVGPLSQLPLITGYANTDAPTAPTVATGDWEWLKKMPRVRSIAGGKRFEIVYEWWGADQWASVMYLGTFDPSPDV